jgi:predicted chitinase
MSKIQEFITAWDTEVNVQIANAQSDIDAYLAARQTAIALTDPFVLKMPTLEVLNIDPRGITIPGFDVTTIGQLFDWSYPAEGMKAYDKYGNYRSKPDVVEDYVDRKYDGDGNTISPTSLYTEGYTYATMSYLAEQYHIGLKTHLDLLNKLNSKDSGFVNLESYKKLKNLGGKVWFDNWMHSLYSVISGTKISVSKLKASDYSDIFMRIEDVMSDNYLKGYYHQGSRLFLGGVNSSSEQSIFFQAVLEAGDAFFPSQTSGTQSGTQSQGSGDYKLEVINPLSDNEKKISGKIVFIEDGQYLIANSTLNGLPNPWTNPVTNTIVPNNTGSITYNANKSTAGKSSLSTDIIINLQNIVQSTYGLTIYLRSTPQDTPTELPKPEEDVPVGSTASIVGSTASVESATASQVLPLQEFIFNVELQDIFSNTDFGNLFIIGKEDTIVFDDDVDYSEYVEDEFIGESEVLPFIPPIADLIEFDKEFDKVMNGTSTDSATNTTTTPVYSGNVKENMRLIALAAKAVGLTSKKAIYSMIAIASGECGLKPQSEGHIYSYNNLKNVFTGLTSDQLNRATRKGISKKEFFNIVYGEYKPDRVGNRNVSDGGLYYGRGFIQLTGHGVYKRYNDLMRKYFPSEKIDIISNPDLVNDAKICAKLVALYFLDRVKTDQNSDAYFTRSLAAVGNDVNGGYAKKTKTYNSLFTAKDQSFIA